MLFIGGASGHWGGPAVADIGVDRQVQLIVTIEAPSDILESGDTLPLTVVVADQYGVPIEGALVVASVIGSAEVSPGEAETDARGQATFEFTSAVEDESEQGALFEATYPGAGDGEASIDVVVYVAPAPSPVPQDMQVITVGIGILALASLAGSEFGRYGLFNALVFPLYTRLKREEVLDHFVRGQIYGFVLSNPGEHYTAIRKHLKVTNGTLSHHLRTLEVQGFVKSRREGTLKRFYPENMVLPRDRGIRLSDLQLRILDRTDEGDGPSQRDIAESVGTTQQAVSYNLRALVRESQVRVEREGRLKRYYPVRA